MNTKKSLQYFIKRVLISQALQNIKNNSNRFQLRFFPISVIVISHILLKKNVTKQFYYFFYNFFY